MNLLEIFGVCIGLLYLFFEYKASIWLWPVSIVMPAIYIFIYHESGFYADAGINVYYFFASIYGWIIWLRKGSKEKPMPITRTPGKYIWLLSLVFAVAFVLIAWILIKFTDSTVPYGDSFTTALSIIGLWMLARKYLEQWLVWIVVDLACTGLYIYKGLYPTAALYALYSIIAVAGYFKWKRLMKEQYETIPTS